MRLLDTVPDPVERAWYARTVEHGWSRAILTHQIETKLYERQGQAQTNVTRTLPAPQSDLARHVLSFLGPQARRCRTMILDTTDCGGGEGYRRAGRTAARRRG